MHKTIAALVLALTVSPMAAWAADGPGRGMSKAQVRQQFGEPARVQAPVGNPPIGRWHYPDFTVYFENDIVLHSVSEDRAARSGEDDGAGRPPPSASVGRANPCPPTWRTRKPRSRWNPHREPGRGFRR
ncbi:hypothetical protein HML84_04370 [Alcanivorax sp. IO_7]|nr:hypothetical protein HML84_04370 [Alcanivorax sp. IO_7]